MMQRLEAEEALAHMDVMAVATGRVKREDARRLINTYQRAARGGRRQVARATPDMLRAMGIGFSVVKG